MYAIRVNPGRAKNPIVVADSEGLTKRTNYVKLSGLVEVKCRSLAGKERSKQAGASIWIEAEYVEFEEIPDENIG